jgi:histidinol-phosphate phosphatase family protein
VLNRRPPKAQYVETWEQFHWIPGAQEALRLFRESGYRIIVVSNQAGVARGAMTAADLKFINDRMIMEAEQAGGRIDAVYCCLHDWDEGCECRKPRPGMLFQAQREHDLDLTRTWFIGDDERDAQAADAACCPCHLVSDQIPLLEIAKRLIGTSSKSST